MFKVPPVPAHRMPELLRGMPKAELHLHIEGSLEPELIFKLAQKNHIQLPYSSVQALRAAYAFTDLQSFLDIYYAGASVLVEEEDFYEMAWAYFLKAVEQRVVHAEIFFDPQTHTARGVPTAFVIQGLSRACRRAEEELGISSALILCFLRHLSEADAFATLEQALPLRAHWTGVGLDSSERGNPPQKFTRVFQECKSLGLHRVAHAGEEGPPEYIWAALDELGVARIDHGVQCTGDSALLKRLADERVPLTVCPLSNVKLKVYPTLAEHPLAQLLSAGLCVSVNSDDPAYFGGYINENFLQTFAALNLGAKEAYALAHNSFESAFVGTAQREKWFHDLKLYFNKFSENDA